MLRKIAVALIATSMFAAPALAADAVKTTSPAAVQTNAASKPAVKATEAVKTVKTVKAVKTATRYHRHRLHYRHHYASQNRRHMSPVAKVATSKPLMAAVPATNATATGKVAVRSHRHHYRHHISTTGQGKQTGEAATVKSASPVKHVKVSKAKKHTTDVLKSKKTSSDKRV
jgi:hypothetical protein